MYPDGGLHPQKYAVLQRKHTLDDFFLNVLLPPIFSISLSPSLLPFLPSSSHRKIQVSFNEKIQNHVSFISRIYVNILTQEINFEWISCLKQCINLEYIIHYLPLFLLLPCIRTSIWFTQYYPTLNDVNINLKFPSKLSVIY